MELAGSSALTRLMAVLAGVMCACLVPTVIVLPTAPLAWGIVAVLLLGGIASAATIALIATRSVSVRSGVLTIRGWHGTKFELEALVPPLRVGTFGVPLGDGATRRLVFAQRPSESAELISRLPDFAQQLRPPTAYPIVLTGRIFAAAAYGVVAVIGAATGTALLLSSLRPPSEGMSRPVGPVIGGASILVVSTVALWWVTRRAQRRVEIHADRFDVVHLIGRRHRRLAALAAVSVVAEARPIPRSSVYRAFHRLRLVSIDGATTEIAPLSFNWPTYGRAEGSLMNGHAWRLRKLAELEQSPADVLRSSRAHEMAVWDHGESSPMAHRYTFVFRHPIGGRHSWSVLHGRASVGGPTADFILGHDDRVVYVVDVARGSVQHVDLADGGSVETLAAGEGKVVFRRSGALAVEHVRDLVARSIPGWSHGESPDLGVPLVTWTDELEATLAAMAAHPRADLLWKLLAARAYSALAVLLRPAEEQYEPDRMFALIVDLARHDDPPRLVLCTGGGRGVVAGPDGRTECRGCGMATTSNGPHSWRAVAGRCDGSFRPPIRDRDGEVCCRTCGLPSTPTAHGFTRLHDASPNLRP